LASSKRSIGVIGVGFGAQVYVPGLQSEGWEVAAVCSRTRDKAAKVAEAAGIRGVHTDPFELINRPDISAVAITTPPASHCELSIAALKAGKHVLCEKPFAMSATEATAMLRAAEASGLTSMVCHEFRYTPQRAFIHQLLGEGYLGRFQLCTIELFLDRYVTAEPRPMSWLALKAEGGGILGALGSHYIDGLRHWFGEVAAVSGHLAILRPDLVDSSKRIVKSETEDTFAFSLHFRSGGLATMIASFAATPARGARITVMGDRGTLIADQPGPNPMEDGIVVGSRDGSPLQPLATPSRYLPFTDSRDPRLMAFRLLAREFATGIDERRSPAPNFADGLRCQELLDAIRVSSESGRTVHLG